MNDQNKPLTGELALLDALDRFAAKHGKEAAMRLVKVWAGVKS